MYSTFSRGTAVAYCATENKAVIAIDSQINHEGGLTSTACKVNHNENIYWVKSGIYRVRDSFDSDKIITSALQIKDGLNFHEKQKLIRDELSSEIKNGLKVLLDNEQGSEIKSSEIPLFSFAIFKFENNRLVFEESHLKYSGNIDNYNLYWEITEDESNLHPGTSVTNVFGNSSLRPLMDDFYLSMQNGTITQETEFSVENNNAFKIKTGVDFVYYLVAQAIVKSDEVGGPISIFTIGEDGVNWIKNESGCK